MPKADSVLGTPWISASSNSSAPGAVQLSSPPVIPTSPANAGQGVRAAPEPCRNSVMHSGGAAVTRRSLMNMLVSAAIAGTAVPAAAANTADPILAAIEAHKAAAAAAEAVAERKSKPL